MSNEPPTNDRNDEKQDHQEERKGTETETKTVETPAGKTTEQTVVEKKDD